ncbi:sensor histidine kinase [Enterococcus sp. RIT-PI-f]|uniref:sensor histidine kinase n=1 Tax=Enterococcus sp. RIT-PI-f TaxID=1690244 RepID=UPI0006B909D2|nr:histidine kinase [Enterococcus sp. RIT-PI-f]KPG70435.1 hypothetical protein AEQ18_07620 [Enterococcus sp. RIT-PI-f]
MSISKRLKLSMVMITCVTVVFTTLLSFLLYFYFSYQDLKANTNNSLDRSASLVENKINEIDILTEKIQFYSKSTYDLMTDLKKYSTENSDYSKNDLYYTGQEIKDIFKTLMYRMEDVNFMAIILPNGSIISYSNTQKDFISFYNPLRSLWYNQALEKAGDLSISIIPNNSIITDSEDEQVLLFSRCLYDFYSKNLLGTIVVSCEPDFFNFMTNDFPDKVIDFQLKDIDSNESLFQKNTDSNLTSTTTISKNINTNRQPLSLSVQIDNSQYYQLFTALIIGNMFILSITFIFIYLSASRYAQNFSLPIIQLAKTMKERAKDNDILSQSKIAEEERNDEIGILYSQYRQMLSTIDNHLIDQINYEQSLLKAELNVYKNQIDSHFLYNTLESINSLAEIKNIPEISNMTLALSSMFRYASNGFNNEATLEQELKNVSDYLIIQRIRFQRQIDFMNLITNDELYHAIIPKITLQPLVENAIFHGLNRGGIRGKIRIFANLRQNALIIRIFDDGLGIDPNHLNVLSNDLANATKLVRERENHIGLINIQARIKNYYGDDYGLSIYSNQNKGTLVILKLPFIKEE